MEKLQFRGYVQIRTFLREGATDIFNDLKALADGQCPSYDTT